LKSPSVLIRQFTLHTTRAFQLMCKQVVVNMCYISQRMRFTKVQTASRSLKVIAIDAIW